MNDSCKFNPLSTMGRNASSKSSIEYLRGIMVTYENTMNKIKSNDFVR